MKDLKSFNFQGKRVLVRCDFNVPLDEEGVILDDFRIRKTIPTIEYLLKEKGRVILMSHMGRPLQSSKFKVQSSKFSLKTVAGRLSELLNRGVRFSEDCVGEEVEEKVSRMEEGDILLLENLRFHKDEENNNEEFSRSLSHLADIYINDAFSVCHRSHASVVGITKYLPSGAGLLLEKEIEILSKIMENPEKPLGLIIAGTKAEDKVKVIEKFLDIADFFLLGDPTTEEVRKRKIKDDSGKIIFPKDSLGGLDIGPLAREVFREKILSAKTIFWAGPLGKIDQEKYQAGTREVIKAILDSKCFSVAGGGDTIEFINKLGVTDKFGHISVGGSAMLAFLAGEKLPGLEVLQ